MSEGGRDGGVVRVGGEDATVCGFSGGGVMHGFGKLTREEGVVDAFGGEFEGFEEIVACGGGIGGLVEVGKGAEGSGFLGVVGRGVGGGGGEFGASFDGLAGASEEEAEGQVRLEVIRVGGDGSLVGSGGGWFVVEGFIGEAKIVEEGSGGSLGGELRKESLAVREILFVECFGGLGAAGVLFGSEGGVGGSCGELGLGWKRDQEQKRTD